MTGEYNDENIRFTTKDNTVYAIQMGWAGSEKEVLIKAFAAHKLNGTKIKNVTVLDSSEAISWKLTDEGLLVKTPFKAPNKLAICFKIETESGWQSMTYEVEPLSKKPITIDG